MKQQSRIVRINNYIIITNYKVMYSSLNSLKITEYLPKDNSSFKKIMLYRSSINRVLSCFLNWMIRNPIKKKLYLNDKYDNLTKNKGNWLLTILKNCVNFDYQLYKERLQNCTSENMIKIFEQFVNILPTIYMKNPHLHPQIKIARKYKLLISNYFNIDKKYHIKKLERMINQKIPVSNQSNDIDKQLLINFLNNNPKCKQKIYNVYKADDILNANF